MAGTHVGCVVGEQFTEESECGRLCTCLSGGQVLCKPRCPVLETSHRSNCSLVPDPADPCCTLPLCHLEESEPNVLGLPDGTTSLTQPTTIEDKETKEPEENLDTEKKPSSSPKPHLTSVADDTKLIKESKIPTLQSNVSNISSHNKTYLSTEEPLTVEKPFTSLNDLLTRHNQLSGFPQSNFGKPAYEKPADPNVIGDVTTEKQRTSPMHFNPLLFLKQNVSHIDTEAAKMNASLLKSVNDSETIQPVLTEDHTSVLLTSEDGFLNSSVRNPDVNSDIKLNKNNERTIYIDNQEHENELSTSDRTGNPSPTSVLLKNQQDGSAPGDDVDTSSISSNSKATVDNPLLKIKNIDNNRFVNHHMKEHEQFLPLRPDEFEAIGGTPLLVDNNTTPVQTDVLQHNDRAHVPSHHLIEHEQYLPLSPDELLAFQHENEDKPFLADDARENLDISGMDTHKIHFEGSVDRESSSHMTHPQEKHKFIKSSVVENPSLQSRTTSGEADGSTSTHLDPLKGKTGILGRREGTRIYI